MKKDPDFDNMNVYELGRYYFDLGDYEKSKKIIEDSINKYEVSSIQMFDLMLQSCIKLDQKIEYLRIHKKYSLISRILEPDFKHLNQYLGIIEMGMFMISGHEKFGTGFSIARNKVITAWELVKDIEPEDIKVTGKFRPIVVREIIHNPKEKSAILVMDDLLRYQFHLGELKYSEFGERVVLAGFTNSGSHDFRNNLSVFESKLQSFDQVDSDVPTRMILNDLIPSDFAGGPVINELGSVIGVLTIESTENEKTIAVPVTNT